METWMFNPRISKRKTRSAKWIKKKSSTRMSKTTIPMASMLRRRAPRRSQRSKSSRSTPKKRSSPITVVF